MAHRRSRARRQGCWVEPTRGGLLRFRFRWRLPGEPDFRKFSEATELRDTPENRALLNKHAAIISAEIRAGTFDAARWFPGSNRTGSIQPSALASEPRAAKAVTIREYHQSWIERKLPPLMRPSRARDCRNHFRTYILPQMAVVELAALSLEHLEDLRLRLHAKQGLGLKTVRNVIDGSLGHVS